MSQSVKLTATERQFLLDWINYGDVGYRDIWSDAAAVELKHSIKKKIIESDNR